MDFELWISGFPGLLWEIEHRRSRITLYNNWILPSLGQDTSRLLKDGGFRSRMILKTDLCLVEEFWDMARNHKNAMVSFRIKCEPDIGYLLQGWIHPSHPEKYFGMLKQSVLPAAYMFKGTAAQRQLALVQSHPVLLVDIGRGEVVECNRAARELFGYPCSSGKKPRLHEIASEDLARKLMALCAECIPSGSFTSPLSLRDGNGNIFSARVRITTFMDAPQIARVALLNVPEPDLKFKPDYAIEDKFRRMELREGLEKLLSLCPGLDGLMFSDIQTKLGRVEVYGVGRLFADVAWGAPHAYEGTIAQDIEKYALDSLVVEDTLDSIKSIDWAMFIPCGVRSYFAKPFFSAQELHAVLILAFARPAAHPLAEENFENLFPPFAALISGWRELKNRDQDI